MIGDKLYKPIYLTADIPAKARAWRNRREVWRWCRQKTLISEFDQYDWHNKIHEDPTIKMFGVYLQGKEANCHIGVCGFTSINKDNQSAEFSLYIAPEFQGRGYGRKALELLLMHGFIDWGFRRIWGEVFEGNPAMEMFEKIGFIHEGTLRSSYWKAGGWIDSHLIALLDIEWKLLQESKLRLLT